ALPCLILGGVFQLTIDRQLFIQLSIIFVISVILNALGVTFGWMTAKALKFSTQKAREVAVLSGFGNTGFIGIPLCAALYGSEGALYAAVFDTGTAIMLWTLGTFVLQQDKQFKLANLKAMI